MDIDFNHLTQEQKNAQLLDAAGYGRTEEVAELINAGADINARCKGIDYHVSTALIEAVLNGHTATAELLIEKGVNIHATDNDDSTALMYAAEKGDTAMVEILIKNGATDHVSFGITQAALHGHTAIVELLINKDPTLIHTGCVLLCAVLGGHMATTELLIEKGADIHVKANDGWTALMDAAVQCRSIAFRLLCAMTPEERKTFSGINENNAALVNEFNQALKDNANRIYDMVMPYCIQVFPGSVFLMVDEGHFLPELVNHIFAQGVLSSQDFPDWYQHRVKDDLILALEFKQKIPMPALIFSQPEIITPNKRKVENDLEEERGTNKVKITSSDQSEDSSEEDMRPEPNSYRTI